MTIEVIENQEKTIYKEVDYFVVSKHLIEIYFLNNSRTSFSRKANTKINTI